MVVLMMKKNTTKSAEKTSNKLAPWDFITKITNDEPYDTTLDGQYVPYMMNRLVSSTDIFMEPICAINEHEVPKDVHYEFLRAIIPKRKMFFKVIVKTAKKVNEYKEAIMDYYECGSSDADSHLLILDDDTKEKILELYNEKMERMG